VAAFLPSLVLTIRSTYSLHCTSGDSAPRRLTFVGNLEAMFRASDKPASGPSTNVGGRDRVLGKSEGIVLLAQKLRGANEIPIP
jgi:hypothetical protein